MNHCLHNSPSSAMGLCCAGCRGTSTRGFLGLTRCGGSWDPITSLSKITAASAPCLSWYWIDRIKWCHNHWHLYLLSASSVLLNPHQTHPQVLPVLNWIFIHAVALCKRQRSSLNGNQKNFIIEVELSWEHTGWNYQLPVLFWEETLSASGSWCSLVLSPPVTPDLTQERAWL